MYFSGIQNTAIKTLITIILLLSVINAAYAVNPITKAEELLKKTESKNKGIKDFSVKFKAKIVCMNMSVPISGSFFFKYPDKIKVEFDSMPSFLRSYKGLFNGLAPSGTAYGASKREFIREEASGGKRLYLIRITPSKKDRKKNIKEIYLWINAKTLNPDFMSVIYADGSSAESENGFPKDRMESLPSYQKAVLKSGIFSAKAAIKYSDYKINSGISDDIFR